MQTLKEKHIVILSAHPDDLEMSCGGTVAKFVEDGNKVTSIVMAGGVPHLEYLNRASGYLGIDPIIFSMSNSVKVDKNVIKELEAMVDFSTVDLIITHWNEDWHQDHQACHEIGNILARKQPMDLWYMSAHPYNLKYKHFTPDLYIDIGSWSYKSKLNAVKAYDNIPNKWVRGVMHHDVWRGSYLDTKYAEVFAVGNQVIK
jgi:LmbE family N-acetylglucosaminyl deacetylase